MDDVEFENMNFEEEERGGEGEEEEDGTESYIEQILFNEKDLNEFDQAWAKFNVEGRKIFLKKIFQWLMNLSYLRSFFFVRRIPAVHIVRRCRHAISKRWNIRRKSKTPSKSFI